MFPQSCPFLLKCGLWFLLYLTDTILLVFRIRPFRNERLYSMNFTTSAMHQRMPFPPGISKHLHLCIFVIYFDPLVPIRQSNRRGTGITKATAKHMEHDSQKAIRRFRFDFIFLF